MSQANQLIEHRTTTTTPNEQPNSGNLSLFQVNFKQRELVNTKKKSQFTSWLTNGLHAESQPTSPDQHQQHNKHQPTFSRPIKGGGGGSGGVMPTDRAKLTTLSNWFTTYTNYCLLASFLFLNLICEHTVFGAIGECNFRKYSTGCYSQANFVCDSETKQCKCHPETPVLIEDRICFKRAKPNEICDYNEQCDNSKGFYCLILTASPTSDKIYPIQCRTTSKFKYNCRCRKYPHDARLEHEGLSVEQLQQRQQHRQLTYDDDNNNNNNNNNASNQHYSDFILSQDIERENKNTQQEFNIDNNFKKRNSNNNNKTAYSSQHHSILPRLVWIFLTISLIGLLALLFLIRFQSYRDARAFRQQYNHHRNNRNQTEEHQGSIDSELDVPPPYEIAIRMKV